MVAPPPAAVVALEEVGVEDDMAVLGRLRIMEEAELPDREAANMAGLDAWACELNNCPATPPVLPCVNFNNRSRAALASRIFFWASSDNL